jgi:hypothetical protein
MQLLSIRFISTKSAQRSTWALIRALIEGTQPNHGWWTPVAQRHIKEVGAGALDTRFTASLATPPTTLTDLGRRYQRREAPLPRRRWDATALH